MPGKRNFGFPPTDTEAALLLPDRMVEFVAHFGLLGLDVLRLRPARKPYHFPAFIGFEFFAFRPMPAKR